jgi:predicted DNA-binding transcriptional regulator AlpA
MAEQLWRRKKVQEVTGLCRSATYAIPDFPRPVSLPGGGRSVFFVASEVEAWIQKTIASSRGANPGHLSAASRSGEQSDSRSMVA